MDKYTWRQVKSLSSSSHKPSSRWGHSCCVVGQDIVFFGGYADSNYMNDLWAFNSSTMKWRQIETTGDVPAQRSNCTMNYDSQNNQLVIFGGGGSNKQRFNSVNILNWETKQWIEITPKQNQVSPWQRTYHVAQLIFPYLIVFGGQGVTDMDDLWVFNFKTLGWTEIKIPYDKIKPCARRFHSSVQMGNEFIILAGCHSKYRCLSDVFSMDMTSLLKTGETDQLQWKEKRLKNSSFLTRWGHSSTVYENKIYIFGGRFSNDLNDLLVADFESGTIKSLKISQEAPAARRRHCAGFIGSSMLIFGGFNGQYFNDLHYISVQQSRPRYEITSTFEEKIYQKYLNKKQQADYCIKTKEAEDFYINIGLIAKYFDNENELNIFLESINNCYQSDQLESIFQLLYCGYGDYCLDKQIKAQLKYPIFDSKNDKLNYQKQIIENSSLQEWQRKWIKKTVQTPSPIIKLSQELFTEYYINYQSQTYNDCYFQIGERKFTINKIKFMLKSEYFFNLFSRKNTQSLQLIDLLGQDNKIIYQIFFNFIETDWLVLSDNVSVDTYLLLTYLADYFCVPILTQLCCNELIQFLTTENVQKILSHSINMKLNNLSKACADFWIKKATETIKIPDLKLQINKTFKAQNKIAELLVNTLSKLGFDLVQVMMETEKNTSPFTKKINNNSNVEKQNYEANIYNN